jgi:hypothetical protein
MTDADPKAKLDTEKPALGLDSESLFRDGIVCPTCGCCSSRRSWSRWTCENKACTFEMTTPNAPLRSTWWDRGISRYERAQRRASELLPGRRRRAITRTTGQGDSFSSVMRAALEYDNPGQQNLGAEATRAQGVEEQNRHGEVLGSGGNGPRPGTLQSELERW